jgi:hypothetical protein
MPPPPPCWWGVRASSKPLVNRLRLDLALLISVDGEVLMTPAMIERLQHLRMAAACPTLDWPALPGA